MKRIHTLKSVFFYLADEGVWGEFIKVLTRRIIRKFNVEITIINIQHGFFNLEAGPLIGFRYLFNNFFQTFMTYPILGYGFGGSKLDTYFVYGNLEKKFVLERSKTSNVIVAPSICKAELINEVYNLQKTERVNYNQINKSILFAAQLNEINPDCNYSEEEITEKIAPLFQVLKESGYQVYYRLHPAIPDKERYIELLEKYGIIQNVILANDKKLSEYLVLVGSVMALQSTTLYDGYVVGRMPIVIRGLSRHFEFTTQHESIDLSRPLDTEVSNAFVNIGKYYLDEVTFKLEPEVKLFFSNM